ncbi:MAG: phosphomannomutase [Azospirillum sp.]|nr:phosphomannomutase [Azospirillum sp.]
MTGGHRLDPTILREYDIRGVVGKTLNLADAIAVGRAFGTIVRRGGGDRVATGYDGRLSSPELEAALTAGLVSTGLAVERIGLGPTPMLYYAVRERRLDAGLMITGSHNPPEYNGIKMMLGKGPVYGEQIQELGRIAAQGDFATGVAGSESIDLTEAYIARLLRDFDGTRPLKVAWDAGNGAAGEIMRRLTERLPGQHILLFDSIDGRFPNHHPDPTVEANLDDLKRAVAQHGCDLGIGFDGDGDRIGAVDQSGRVVWGDQLLALYAAEVLAQQPGATVIADVKASQVLFDEIARLGGTPLMWKTGHSLLKAKMAETGAPLAGEMSGHIFFADKWYGFDDALYCALRLIALVSRSGSSLGALRDRLPSVVNTPEIRFQVSEARKFAVIDEVKARLRAEDATVTDIDGVRVTTPDGWWLLRASNTQDVLVARCEAFSEPALARLKAVLTAQLGASGIAAPAVF